MNRKKAKQLKFFHSSECKGLVFVSLITLVEGFEIWFEGLCTKCGAHVKCVKKLESLIAMTPKSPKRR